MPQIKLNPENIQKPIKIGRSTRVRKSAEIPLRPFSVGEFGDNVYEHPTRILGAFRLARAI